jgi:hypothetical protein
MDPSNKTCRACGQTFNSDSELQEHRRSIHESETIPMGTDIDEIEEVDIEGEDEQQVA